MDCSDVIFEVSRLSRFIKINSILIFLYIYACYILGAISSMPAVRAFSLFAGQAIFFDYLLQISVFVAILSIDVARQQAKRPELCCCVRLKSPDEHRRNLNVNEDQGPTCDPHDVINEGLIRYFIRRFYSPFLLFAPVKLCVVSIINSGFWRFTVQRIGQK